MVQFKEVFLGRERRPYVRAVSSQRCVRAGGKHNDLENVGYTARHHTFFEMLGQLQLRRLFQARGDRLRLGLPDPGPGACPRSGSGSRSSRRTTRPPTSGSKEIGVDPARFSRCGAKDNFWSMGETGPCGPCSEIFYDHGPEIPGGPPGSPDADGDRYVEIWNLVFMQFNRAADGTLTPLPRPSVDTGMGLERLAAVMQGVHSNYEIDLFVNLIAAAAEVTGCADRNDKSLRVIADHIRSTAFLIADGVMPGNEGRGYVLRRIMRRAIRHGYRLGCSEPFFYRLVAPLVAEMGEAYPELAAAQAQVERAIRVEEERFAETLANGMGILDEAIAGLAGERIPGETVFKLYDTYGFPTDLTADIARERGLVPGHGRIRAAPWSSRRSAPGPPASSAPARRWRWMSRARPSSAATTPWPSRPRWSALFRDGQSCDTLEAGAEGLVVLDVTPFYGESGGQVGDRGVLIAETGRFEVSDTQKQGEGVICHLGRVTEGQIAVGDAVEAQVDAERRRAIALNHSATHLLHAALRQVLGDHVQQKGLAGRAGAAALRLLALRAGDARAAAGDRAPGQPGDSREPHGRDPDHEPGGRQDHRGHGAVRREILPIRCGSCAWGTSPPSCAAAPMSRRWATSGSSRSSPRAASPPACGASRP